MALKNIILLHAPGNGNEYIENLISAYERNSEIPIKYGVKLVLDTHENSLIHIQRPELLYSFYKDTLKLNDAEVTDIIKDKIQELARKNTIIYTVHNLVPHDRTEEKFKIIYEIVYEYSDIIAHHGEYSKLHFEKNSLAPTATHIVCPHGPYRHNLKTANSKRDIPKVLNVGRQRTYKGNRFLLVALKANVFDACKLSTVGPLIVTGKSFWVRLIKIFLEKMIHQLFAVSFGNYSFKFCSLSHDELHKEVNSADCLILGHSSGLTTGLIPLAISHNKAFIYIQ